MLLRFIKALVFCAFVSGLLACGTDTSSGDQTTSIDGSGNSATGTSTGDVSITTSDGSSLSAASISQLKPQFSLRITDAPADDVVKVVLVVTAVELLAEDGSESVRFTYNNPRQIDLMLLQGIRSASLLHKVPLPANDYTEIRLLLDDTGMANFVEFRDGGVQELKIPGASSSGLKLKGGIPVSAGRDTAFTVDLDLRQSLVFAGASGNLLLKPVIRLIDDSAMGHISGTVDQSLLVASSCSDSDVDTYNSVYVFPGHDVVPGDINQLSIKSNSPVTTSNIYYDADSDSYRYEAAFLPAGDYTIALTCNADADDLEVDNDLKFFDIRNTVVLANNTTFL